MAYTPTANAAESAGGAYNASRVAGAYDYVVVRRRPVAVVRRPVRRGVVVVR
jgi:hypothetical protein